MQRSIKYIVTQWKVEILRKSHGCIINSWQLYWTVTPKWSTSEVGCWDRKYELSKVRKYRKYAILFQPLFFGCPKPGQLPIKWHFVLRKLSLRHSVDNPAVFLFLFRVSWQLSETGFQNCAITSSVPSNAWLKSALEIRPLISIQTRFKSPLEAMQA